MNQEKIYYTYDDISLVPQYSEVRSRLAVDYSVNIYFRGNSTPVTFPSPIITSNMDTITESEMAICAAGNSSTGALHRFMSIEDNVKEYLKVKNAGCDCFVSIGVGDESMERATSLYNSGARNFIIDVAHGHTILVKETIIALRQMYGDSVFIIAGNVATRKAVEDLSFWGANTLKIGIGGGGTCKTRIVTGFGIPMFTCLQECASEADICYTSIVADGGIRTSGDIMKALVAGADFVMIGSLLAGTKETPGEVINDWKDDVFKGSVKIFRGMASKSAMRARNFEKIDFVAEEGESMAVPARGSASIVFNDLLKGLSSAMTYCGVDKLSKLSKKNVDFVIQTTNGYIESTPHKLNHRG